MPFVFRVVEAFKRHRVPYAIVGGFAVALHGAIRGTVDIDLVIGISEKDFVGCEKAMHSLGLESHIPVSGKQIFQFRKEYIENRNLIAWNFYNPKNSTEVIDIILNEDLLDLNPVSIQAGTHTLKVASISDLIRMKSKSGRPQDLADIQALKSLFKEMKP